ncbi:MAG: Ni/Fe-hydrogenase cytochrome b subunit [Thermoanaerobaculia bacterium]|nr:Ni/Fe-hydrogenase cytochrome b subunit [Thermoanaerobaculia bacterium]
MNMPKITFWRVVFALIMIAGAYATFVRITQGLGATTNLSDEFPWGIWIGFDVLCGVMLAAGGFTLMAAVHIFNAERFRPIVRPALLTAFLGYLLVVVALMFDLGFPWRIWHPLIMWNPRSVMFEVGWCVTLYTTVLALEFSPLVFERLRLERPLKIIHTIQIPLVIMGVILSTLHQSSLGSLYLIVPGKLHPLWYTSMLPVLFFVSAIAIGIAMTIFESGMSEKHLGHSLDKAIVIYLSRILLVVLIFHGVLRFRDLYKRHALGFAVDGSYESILFLAEVLLTIFIPIALLAIPRVRLSPRALFGVSTMVVIGFMINRLNIAITGMEGYAGVRYFPKWTELSVTVAIVAAGFAIFGLATKYLPIFEHGTESHEATETPAATVAKPYPAQA